MPETPDFDQIAQTLIHDAAMIVGALSAGTDCLPARRNIAAQLRLVWNARGAADADLFTDELDHRDIIERIATLDR